MRLLALALVAATTAVAAAQPNPGQRPTVTTVTAFERCSKVTMFACGMHDANGQTYGTARETQHCESIVLRPDGTFAGTLEPGTYSIFAGKVHFKTATESFDLPLSPDGQRLGDLLRKR